KPGSRSAELSVLDGKAAEGIGSAANTPTSDRAILDAVDEGGIRYRSLFREPRRLKSQELIDMASMDGGMAPRSGGTVRSGIEMADRFVGVTLETEAFAGDAAQLLERGAVRHVAGHAALGESAADGRMFEHERPLFFGVTGETEQVAGLTQHPGVRAG